MKASVPASKVDATHPDHEVLCEIASDILARAGGAAALGTGFATMLRACIDDVIMTPKTGRRSYDELEKTEKTYIGTRVEIELRALLRLPKGKLDTRIRGHDVDIKNTMGSNWMIPTEALNHPCILVAADEVQAKSYLGLIVARPAYLTQGQNKDAKKTVSAQGFENIMWLLRDHPYPPNFWRTVPADATRRIFARQTGNARMAALFREVQGVAITRDVVEAVAQQRDFMRRIRSDSGRGTRDHLAREGLLLLSGHYDTSLIAALGLPLCTASEFVSYRPKNAEECALAAAYGISLGPELI